MLALKHWAMSGCCLVVILALGSFCSARGAEEGTVNPEDISPRETTANDGAQTARGGDAESRDERSLPTPPQAFPPTPSATENGVTAGPVHRSDEGSDDGGSAEGECWADHQVTSQQYQQIVANEQRTF